MIGTVENGLSEILPFRLNNITKILINKNIIMIIILDKF